MWWLNIGHHVDGLDFFLKNQDRADQVPIAMKIKF
jgi:hypothetical protein